MKAVFLDKSTFSAGINFTQAPSLTGFDSYDATAHHDKQSIIERCKGYEIVITNKVPLCKEVLQALPELKLIQLTATGMNNVDAETCKQLGIRLKNVSGYAVKSVPEHTFMLMLNAMRAGVHYHTACTDGRWQATNSFCLMDQPLYDLEGKTLGIIGAGTIGKRVSDIAKAFGMTVLWAERQSKAPRNTDYTDFNTVLAQADVISLHCPLTEDTHHLINKHTIAKMLKKPLVVNVARGDVVKADDMTNAIKNNQLLGYASDVFEQEPMTTDNPLFELANHPRVVFSPHNAWGSESAQQHLWDIAMAQVEEFISQNNNPAL